MPNVELPGEPGTGVAEDIIGRLLPEWWSRFQPKNKAYGGELARGGGLGIKAFIPEMNRKMSGIVREIWHGEIPQGEAENAREKAMDLIGHLFIFVSNMDAGKDKGPRVGHDLNAIVDRAIGASRAARLSGGDGKAVGLAKVEEMAAEQRRCCTGTPSNDWGHVTDCPERFLPVRTEEELRKERWLVNGEDPEGLRTHRCLSTIRHEAHSWKPVSMKRAWCDGAGYLATVEDENEPLEVLGVKQCADTRSHHAHDWRLLGTLTGVRCNGYTAPF